MDKNEIEIIALFVLVLILTLIYIIVIKFNTDREINSLWGRLKEIEKKLYQHEKLESDDKA
jgi:hypothetical protein